MAEERQIALAALSSGGDAELPNLLARWDELDALLDAPLATAPMTDQDRELAAVREALGV